MLGLLPDWLRERIQDQLDRIIHASMALTVAFTGMSLEDLVLIIPALVSVTISRSRRHRTRQAAVACPAYPQRTSPDTPARQTSLLHTTW